MPFAPKQLTWLLGLALGICGIVGHFTHVNILHQYNYLLLLSGFIVLAAGTTFRGL
jgi:hypothetical protein